MNKKFLVFFPLFSLFFQSCFILKDSKSEKVVSSGMAPIYSENVVDARHLAVLDALKEALHKVLGVYISQDMEISKSILLDENILSTTNGYIEKYEILKETRDGNFYKVKIKSKVKKEPPTLKIKDYDYKKIGNPKIFINIDEYVDDVLSNQNIAKNIISSFFLNRRVTLLDKNENFDIFIYGNVKTFFAFDIKGIKSYLAKIDLKVLDSKTNKLIKIYSFENKGVGVNSAEASKNSIEKVVNLVLEVIYEDIYDYFDRNILIEIFISASKSLDDVIAIKNKIQAFANVKEVKIKNFENNSLVLNVYCKNSDILEKWIYFFTRIIRLL